MDWGSAYIEALITGALKEDVGSGDVAVAATVSPTTNINAHFVADEELVCTGLPLIERILSRLDPEISVELNATEGRKVSKGGMLATMDGNAGAILTGEQTMRNFLGRLCGIATRTRQFADQVSGTRARICDSRKTTPGLRQLEQYAMEMGGGVHHHAGLFDAIVLTKAHISAAGGIKAALDQVHSHVSRLMNPLPLTAYEATGTAPSDDTSSLPIQIAIQDEVQLREALCAGAYSILLQDMLAERVGQLTQMARSIRPDCVVEIAGDISLESARGYAESGVDYISPDAVIASARTAAIRLLVDGF